MMTLKCLSRCKIKSIKNPGDYTNYSLKKWIIENSNESIYNKVFLPLLKAKYGSSFDNISTAWFIERMKIRAQRGVSAEILTYMMGGFNQLTEKLKDDIRSNGGTIVTGANIKGVKGGREGERRGTAVSI